MLRTDNGNFRSSRSLRLKKGRQQYEGGGPVVELAVLALEAVFDGSNSSQNLSGADVNMVAAVSRQSDRIFLHSSNESRGGWRYGEEGWRTNKLTE